MIEEADISIQRHVIYKNNGIVAGSQNSIYALTFASFLRNALYHDCIYLFNTVSCAKKGK